MGSRGAKDKSAAKPRGKRSGIRRITKGARRHAPRRSGQNTENDALARERDEARAQQAATAEILQVINNSRINIQPVFDAIVRAGARLFRNAAVTIAVPDGD